MNFSVSHNPIDAQQWRDHWTNGDVLSGQVRLDLAKECHVKSMVIKLKCKADVWWKQGRNGYSSKEKHFSLKQFIIADPGLVNWVNGVVCDGCDKEINEPWYQCTVCPDYDLCSGCQSTGLHGEHRLMFRLCPHSQEEAGRQPSTDEPVKPPEEAIDRPSTDEPVKPPEEDGYPLLTDEHGKPYTNVVAAGCHRYPFTFQFPDYQDLPPTFKGEHGKIRYTLEARLCRPMRLDTKDITKLNFIPKFIPKPELMTPQHETKEKEMALFTSGTVAMDVNLDKMGYCQGEGINVVASIENNSSRDIKPKYCLYQKQSFFARGQRNVETKDILKEVGEVIPPSCHQTVTRTITVPPQLTPSILCSNVIKVEYRLRVYLDVKYDTDPQIKFPIVILPAAPEPPARTPAVLQRPPSYAAFGGEPSGVPTGPGCSPAFGAPGGPSAPPALSDPTQSGDDHPPPYHSCGMYPTTSENFL